MTKCSICGAPAPSVDGRCAACGALRTDVGEGVTFIGDGALFPPAAARPVGASDATQWPSDTLTRRGVYADAPTDAGLDSDEATGAGLPPPKKLPHSAVATATPPPPIAPSTKRASAAPPPPPRDIDPDTTMIGGPDVTRIVEQDLTRYVPPPEEEATKIGAAAGVTRMSDLDRTRAGMPDGIVVKPTSGPTGPLEPGTPFGPRYHIVQLLGLGGMGAVYKAWDAELGVLVAV